MAQRQSPYPASMLRLAVVLGLVSLMAAWLSADSLVPAEAEPSYQAALLRYELEISAAESAMAAGFAGVAQHILTSWLDRDLPDVQRERLLILALRLAIAQGDVRAVADWDQRLQAEGFRVPLLLSAFVRWMERDMSAATALVEVISFDAVDPSDRPWLALLRALLLLHSGDNESANELFAMAARLAPTPVLENHFEVIRIREEMLQRRSDPDTVSALRETVRALRGERAGFEAARLLAISLNLRGDKDEAIQILNQQLASAGLRGAGLRADFLLLVGYMAGPESVRGQLALRQIIEEGEGGAIPPLALTMLTFALVDSGQKAAFLQDIADWLERPENTPMTDRLLAHGAFLAAQLGRYAEAEAYARRLLDGHPESPHVLDALRSLAFISWNRRPPQYRTAADFLNQIRAQLPQGRERQQVGILMADCFFLNGDFVSASEAYGAALREVNDARAGRLLFQRVVSELAAGRFSLAQQFLDQAHRDDRLNPIYLWKAEWNLVQQMRQSGNPTDAIVRLQRFIEVNPLDVTRIGDLSVRMHWLYGRLLLETGNPDRALATANLLYQRLDDVLDEEDWEAPISLVRSHLLLLIGESFMELGQRSDALETFALLRANHPESAAAILSFLVESRSALREDSLTGGQRSLLDLVEQFPNSPYAPIALWEAALNSEQRGLNVHLQEAIAILERLVTQYPQHALVFFARIKQGDIARRLNDFPSALLLYERAIAQFPDHPERFRAELNRADTLMALATDDRRRAEAAIILYERNTLLASVPAAVRLEAGYKWARALLQLGDIPGFEAALWLAYHRLIEDSNVNARIFAQDAGRYWAARLLIELAEFQLSADLPNLARQLLVRHIELQLPGIQQVESRLQALDEM